MATKLMGLKEAAAYLGVDLVYMRRLVLEGKVPSTKVPVRPGSSVLKHVITQEALDARKAAARGNSRSDGRNKWVVYATREEMAKLAKVAADMGLPTPYMPNEGEYQRRKAAKAAAGE